MCLGWACRIYNSGRVEECIECVLNIGSVWACFVDDVSQQHSSMANDEVGHHGQSLIGSKWIVQEGSTRGPDLLTMSSFQCMCGGYGLCSWRGIDGEVCINYNKVQLVHTQTHTLHDHCETE